MDLTQLYQIDGAPIVAPNAGVKLGLTDIEAPETGRDESGFLHRTVLRTGIATWQLCYERLTRQAYEYMQSILPRTGSFAFTHPACQSAGSTLSRCCLAGAESVCKTTAAGICWDLKITVKQC